MARRRLPALIVALVVFVPAASAGAATGGASPSTTRGLNGGTLAGIAPTLLDGGTTPTGPVSGPVSGGGSGIRDIPRAYLKLYRAADRTTGVSWRLLAAVGKNESDHGRSRLPGIASGLNSAGCCAGPMQICTVSACGNTWSAYRVDGNRDGRASPYQPADAVHASARILRDLKRLFGNHPALILAGYNAGPGSVQRYRGVPPFQETRSYVARGLGYMRALR